MKNYIAHIEQQGEGCDYTIGCGQAIIEIESENIDSAESLLKNIIKEEFSRERELEKVVLYEVSIKKNLDTSSIYSELEYEKEKEKLSAQRVLDEQEFQRLKMKLKF